MNNNIYTVVEENYIKSIYHIIKNSKRKVVKTSELATYLQQKPSTVSDTIDRLHKKSLVTYKKYYGVSLTKKGTFCALGVIRRHRLWEFFLHNTLGFAWNQVHEIAEELEHVRSPLLIEKLDAFLGHPTKDPHGGFIPTESGEVDDEKYTALSSASTKEKVCIEAVQSKEKELLQYLNKIEIAIGNIYEVVAIEPYDKSITIQPRKGKPIHLSEKIASSIYVSVEPLV